MIRPLIAAAALIGLCATAGAEVSDTFQAEISVNRTALSNQATAAAEIASIRNQAIKACTYENESVLSQQYDEDCASSLVAQVINGTQTAELDSQKKS
jgi:UrcA family protein